MSILMSMFSFETFCILKQELCMCLLQIRNTHQTNQTHQENKKKKGVWIISLVTIIAFIWFYSLLN